MSSLLTLSQHLEARLSSQSGELLLCNLAHGTRLVAQADSWEKLAAYQQGAPLPQDDPWLERACDAKILLPLAPPQNKDFPQCEAGWLQRLAQALAKPEAQEWTEALALAQRQFRQQHMPGPFQGRPETVGPLMHKPERLVDFFFDHCQAFVAHDRQVQAGLDLEFLRLCSSRPPMKLRYEQQYCTPFSSQRRAQLIAEAVPPQGRILVLGDDDLVSLALSRQGLAVDVLELDEDLVSFLQSHAPPNLKVLQYNLRQGVPESMRQHYDVVTTDPPYSSEGMRFFLECAAEALKGQPSSRLFLSTYPGLLEDPQQLTLDLEELAFELQQQSPYFSRYPYPNGYRVEHLSALRQLGCPLHPTLELLGFPFLYSHFFIYAPKGENPEKS